MHTDRAWRWPHASTARSKEVTSSGHLSCNQVPLASFLCTPFPASSEMGTFFKKLIFWLHRTACKIFFPGPGVEPVTPAVEVQSLSHWTAREVPETDTFFCPISRPGKLHLREVRVLGEVGLRLFISWGKGLGFTGEQPNLRVHTGTTVSSCLC